MDDFTKKCWMIKNAFTIDVEVIDESFKPVLHICNDTQPLLIIDARKKLYPGFRKVLNDENKHSICFDNDSFHLSYMAAAIENNEKQNCIVIAGPFINERVSDDFIWKVIKQNKLGNDWLKPLSDYYKTIPYLRDTYLSLGDVLANICANPIVSTKIITAQNSEVYSHTDLPPEKKDRGEGDIKLRYKIEKELLHAVETGDKKKALEILVHFTGEFLYRVPGNPLRARKNISYASNTMLRIAAEKGGVSPEYLHLLSEKFAIKIEKAITMSELDTLEITMTEEYCDMVKKQSVKGHSPVVVQALKYINMNFDKPINLQSTADEIGFDRTYVAKKFKEEMNMTVIDYINNKRIDEAAFLIRQGIHSITEISMRVGFTSYNYFCKVFKDIKGINSTEYKRQCES